MKIGDLVKFRNRSDWLGIIVRAHPGTMKLKTVQWLHTLHSDFGPSAIAEKYLELVNENR